MFLCCTYTRVRRSEPVSPIRIVSQNPRVQPRAIGIEVPNQALDRWAFRAEEHRGVSSFTDKCEASSIEFHDDTCRPSVEVHPAGVIQEWEEFKMLPRYTIQV